jgi:hypothetical protein
MTIQISEIDEEVQIAQISEEIFAFEWPVISDMKLVDDLERRLQIKDRRLLLLSRNKIISSGETFVRRVKSNIIKSYPDAQIQDIYFGENYLYITASVSSFTQENVKVFKNGSWFFGSEIGKNKSLAIQEIATALESMELSEQLGIILSNFTFAVRLWPWEVSDLWQCFTLRQRISE